MESATGKALDISAGSTANEANLQTYSWNGTDAQLWKFVNIGSGNYYIRSKLGTVIDIAGGSIKAGSNIQMYTSNYSNAQKWNLIIKQPNHCKRSIRTFNFFCFFVFL